VNFTESETYLLSLGNEVETMKLGLDNIRKLLAALGDPQTTYLKVQVAGTNGKGSVCAFLDSICCTANISTGTFTSPHLISITERIRINGSDINEVDFARHATTVREAAESMVAARDLEYTPTFFEQVTAIALLAFAESKVKLAILETGMGGRFDATTAANAEIAAITRVDIDHQQYLGETISEIAAEKAAIIRPDTDFLAVAEQSSEPNNVILARCREVGVEPHFADFVQVNGTENSISFQTDLTDYEVDRLGLAGRHQIANAKVAILVAEELARRFSILRADIIIGLENARHPGRLEYHGRFLLDGAHNAGGATALASHLADCEAGRSITMVFASMRDKQVADIAELLFPLADDLILTKVDSPRSFTADELRNATSFDNAALTDSVDDAIKQAEAITNDSLIVITGSLYLVGEAKRVLAARSEI
jgi:dihydrofolate synthase / folylpolyglutamate synthase